MSLLSYELTWTNHDAHANLTRLAAAMVGLAFAFAIFGLPPFGLHAPPHYAGVMAPTCGLTRGVVALARGSLADAVRYNPASILVVAGAFGVLVRAVAGAYAGRWLHIRVRPSLVGWAVLGIAAVALAVNQQLHAGLLR